MFFLFVIGVEGSGHALIKSIMQDFMKKTCFVNEGDWHEPMVKFWNPSSNPKVRDKEKAKIEKALKKYLNAGYTHLFDSASFPHLQPRDSLRHFDIIEMVKLLRPLMDLRFLVIYRDPVCAVYSAVRRKITNNLYLQARIVEDNLIYINNQLLALSGHIFRVVKFKELLNDPLAFTAPLAKWWNLNESMLQKGTMALKKPHALEDIPNDTRLFLEEYFDPIRLLQWKDLLSEKNNLINFTG